MCTLDTFPKQPYTRLTRPPTRRTLQHHTTYPRATYYAGGQDKEWLGCLKSHLLPAAAQTKRHTTHDTPHNLMLGKREGGRQKKQGLPRLFRDYFDILYYLSQSEAT